MEGINQYLVTKRFKGRAVCGRLNLPFGTKCMEKKGWICCDEGIVCNTRSENAHDFFTWDGDGCGEKRRKLIDGISRNLDGSRQSKEAYDAKWEVVWNDDTCLKYKRKEYSDY